MENMDLDSMNYAELRSLAKQFGLKANLKAEKLLKALKQHYDQQKNTQEEKKEEFEVEICPAPPVFVNTRRGRAKNKRADVENKFPTEDEAKLDEESGEAVSAGPPQHDDKRRRVSSPSKMETAGKQVVVVLEDVQLRSATKNEVPRPKAGKIPRLIGDLAKRKPLKPVTPNFKKLHEAQFNKLESIDEYMQRKNRKTEPIQKPVKELKAVKPRRSSKFTPAAKSSSSKKTTEDKRRATLLSASKDPAKKTAGKKDAMAFKPSVLSTRRINVRFTEATPDNEYKMSLLKTPSRMSFNVVASTPNEGRKSKCVRASTFSVTKTPATFVFTGNTSSLTPATQKKGTFDLKASLSRPLAYKPHTGKLKPFGDVSDVKTADKSLISNPRQQNYKQHKVQTRDERQVKQAEDRKQKKSAMLCARRGLVMT
ncbi:nucleolar and spindle-associated protein 1 isoform X2 [Entelurus aequoreus]|uniref:nucleolar and spindle-associated protein 1 isoform X2 n=1 Tax=Entelurus aequoreus TaxID=161455 RepID=UPI002B1D5D69|nr:nucleolar and spindle-associated protein 1 isoform X2 [Entelurus aequoreus]